jgi:hypothetical protein
MTDIYCINPAPIQKQRYSALLQSLPLPTELIDHIYTFEFKRKHAIATLLYTHFKKIEHTAMTLGCKYLLSTTDTQRTKNFQYSVLTTPSLNTVEIMYSRRPSLPLTEQPPKLYLTYSTTVGETDLVSSETNVDMRLSTDNPISQYCRNHVFTLAFSTPH